MYDAWDEQEKHDMRVGKYDLLSLHTVRRHQVRVHVHRGQRPEESFANIEVLSGATWRQLHRLINPQIFGHSAYHQNIANLKDAAKADRQQLVKVAETLLIGRTSTGEEQDGYS